MAKKKLREVVPALGAWPQDEAGKDLKVLEHEELKAIADEVIEDYHPDLTNIRFRFGFVKTAFTVSGAKRFGKVTKLGGFNHEIFAADATVKIAWEPWSQMDRNTKIAFMDHLLSHLSRDVESDGSGVLHYQSPDVAEFPAVIRRHGAWWEGLKKLGYAIQQLRIEFEAPAEDEEEGEESEEGEGVHASDSADDAGGFRRAEAQAGQA